MTETAISALADDNAIASAKLLAITACGLLDSRDRSVAARAESAARGG